MHLGDEGKSTDYLFLFAVSHNDRTTYCMEEPTLKCVFYEKGR